MVLVIQGSVLPVRSNRPAEPLPWRILSAIRTSLPEIAETVRASVLEYLTRWRAGGAGLSSRGATRGRQGAIRRFLAFNILKIRVAS